MENLEFNLDASFKFKTQNSHFKKRGVTSDYLNIIGDFDIDFQVFWNLGSIWFLTLLLILLFKSGVVSTYIEYFAQVQSGEIRK